MYKLGNIKQASCQLLAFPPDVPQDAFPASRFYKCSLWPCKVKAKCHTVYAFGCGTEISECAPPRSSPLLQLLQLVPALELAAGGTKTSFEYVKQHG